MRPRISILLSIALLSFLASFAATGEPDASAHGRSGKSCKHRGGGKASRGQMARSGGDQGGATAQSRTADGNAAEDGETSGGDDGAAESAGDGGAQFSRRSTASPRPAAGEPSDEDVQPTSRTTSADTGDEAESSDAESGSQRSMNRHGKRGYQKYGSARRHGKGGQSWGSHRSHGGHFKKAMARRGAFSDFKRCLSYAQGPRSRAACGRFMYGHRRWGHGR